MEWGELMWDDQARSESGGQWAPESESESPPVAAGGLSEFATAAAVAWRTYHPGGSGEAGAVLTPDEEMWLARRIAEGDDEARHRLISANYRLVFHVVSRFRHTGVPVEDLIQEGNLGLIEAADRFDATRGVRFNTYALLWIRGAVLRASVRLRALMPIPERMAQAAMRMRREEDALAQELMREPTADEIADRIGQSAAWIDEARHLLRPHTSLDSTESDEGRPADEWLSDSSGPHADVRLVQAELAAAVQASLEHLTPRERDVLRLRFGLDSDEPRSLADVGRALDISRQRARELEQSALQRLRNRPPEGIDIDPGLASAGD